MRYKKHLNLLRLQKGAKQSPKKPLLQRILSDCQLLKFPKWFFKADNKR